MDERMTWAYQVDFGALVRIRLMKQKAAARLHQVAAHLNVVMGKIQQ